MLFPPLLAPALVKVARKRGSIPCPLLISRQTFLPLAGAVTTPGFRRLPALGLAMGLSPGTTLDAVAPVAPFLALTTPSRLSYHHSLGPHSAVSVLPCLLWPTLGFLGTSEIQLLDLSRTRDLEWDTLAPVFLVGPPGCRAPILPSDFFWSHKEMSTGLPISKWNSSFFCLQVPPVTRGLSLWTSLSWLWR